MRRLVNTFMVVVTTSSICWAAGPILTDISAAQRTDGSGIVDIFYTLEHPDGLACEITVYISKVNMFMPYATALSGDVGPSISPGTRHIVWDSKVDLPGEYSTQWRVRLIANDNPSGPPEPPSGPPPGMEFVIVIDFFGFVGQMSKYETTNDQYCHFLNQALASGDLTVNNFNDPIGQSGSNSGVDYPGERYYYDGGNGQYEAGATNGGAARINCSASGFSVQSGFGNHPVTYVTWYGAMAFANYYNYYLPTRSQWLTVADYISDFDSSVGEYTWATGWGINPQIANYSESFHPHGTVPVGSFDECGYGLCDMTGNVAEWTSPISPDDYSQYAVLGGSWLSDRNGCKLANEGNSFPTMSIYTIGFRVCRD